MEKYREEGKLDNLWKNTERRKVFTCIYNLEKAYDRVPIDLIRWVLDKRSVPRNYTSIIKDTHEGVVMNVRTTCGETWYSNDCRFASRVNTFQLWVRIYEFSQQDRLEWRVIIHVTNPNIVGTTLWWWRRLQWFRKFAHKQVIGRPFKHPTPTWMSCSQAGTTRKAIQCLWTWQFLNKPLSHVTLCVIF